MVKKDKSPRSKPGLTRAGQALRQSEAYFHSLTDNAVDVILVIGADGVRKYVSPSIEQVRGYKPEELIGREAIEGVHPDDVPKIADIFVQLTENPGKLLQWECRLRHKDGSWRIVEGISRNLFDNPAVAGIVSNYRDITERKKAEEKEQEYIYELSFLSLAAAEMLELAPEKDIYQFIGEKLKELAGDAFVFINSFDESSATFCLRAAPGISEQEGQIIDILGEQLVGLATPISDEARAGLTSGRLEKVAGGIYSLAAGGIPEDVCHDVEKLLGMGEVYAIGFSWGEELFGSAVMLLHKGAELRNPSLIEIFAHQASLALQRWQAEKSLRESEEKHRTLFDTMTQGVVYYDSEMKVVSRNEAAEKILGIKIHERQLIEPRAPGVYIIREDGSDFPRQEYPVFVALRTGKECQNVVIGVYNPEKQDYIWININVVPQFRPGEDKPFRVYTIFEDITERKRAEDALRKARDELETRVEERTGELREANVALQTEVAERKRAQEALKNSLEYLAKLNDSLQEVIFTAKMPERVIAYVNHSVKDVFGYGLEECIGKTTEFLYPNKNGYESFGNKLKEALEERRNSLHAEHLMRRKNGEVFPAEITVTFLEEDGGITQVISVLRDITESKRAEEELLKYREQLEELVMIRTEDLRKEITERKKAEDELRKSIQLLNDTGEMAKVGGWELDLATKEVSWTEEVARIHGVSPRYKMSLEEAINFYAPESIPVLEETLKKTSETGEPYDLESLFITSGSKDKIWVRSLGRAIYSGGKIVKLAGTFQNIDKYKRGEEQLQASLKEKEALLSEVHHRVKNNFQLISSLLDMVGMRARNEETVRLCASVHARVHAMGLIHSQLYQSGSLAELDVGAQIKELVSYLAQIHASNGKTVTYFIEPSDIHLGITQAVPCALALNEVISNAFKHAFQGRQSGTIEISLRKLADAMVSIRVKDDGIGMPEDFDIDRTSTLGIKLTRNLVREQLKGSIQFRRGEGTEVIIEFKAG